MSQLKKRSLIPNPSRLIWHTAGGGFGNRKSNFSPVSNHHRFINPLSYGIKISRKIVFLSKCHAVFARYSEGMYSAGPLTCEKAIPMGFLSDSIAIPDGFWTSRKSAEEAHGAKYICFTSRHHEGFSMFHTKYSDYNIVDATPFKRDIVKELADECHKQGIRLHFYYSHIDWHREDAPWGRTGRGTGRPNPKGDWKSYYTFMNNQLTELLTNYGPIGAIWFDGWWDQDANPDFDWQLPEQYALIHGLQPACLVGNNHHQMPFPGEDIQIFERDLPGENRAGLSGQDVSRLPLETCETMNGMWGYKITDQEYKSTKTLIHYLVKAAGKNANLLMNIGPQPDGCFLPHGWMYWTGTQKRPEVAVQRLKEVGEWLKVYGETIYGTRGGMVVPHDWGVTTQKGNRLFVHILNLKDNALYLPLDGKRVKKGFLFKDQSPVRITRAGQGVVLQLPEVPSDTDYVIELQLVGQ